MTPYYQQDNITIYCGRAEDVLPLPNIHADLLLTDPPYGIGASRRNGFGNGVTGVYKTGFLKGQKRIGTREYREGDWDDQPASRELIDLAQGVLFGAKESA